MVHKRLEFFLVANFLILRSTQSPLQTLSRNFYPLLYNVSVNWSSFYCTKLCCRYVVKTLDNAESVKLQYRSLAKALEDPSAKATPSKMVSNWL